MASEHTKEQYQAKYQAKCVQVQAKEEWTRAALAVINNSPEHSHSTCERVVEAAVWCALAEAESHRRRYLSEAAEAGHSVAEWSKLRHYGNEYLADQQRDLEKMLDGMAARLLNLRNKLPEMMINLAARYDSVTVY